MKEFLSKISAFLLALIVLFSSSFVIVDTHYCYGEEIDSSFIGSADGCGMGMSSCSLEDSPSSLLESECCNNTFDFKFATTFKVQHHEKIDTQQVSFTSLFCSTSTVFFTPIKPLNDFTSDYRVPLIIDDIYILNECLLI